MTAHWIAHLQQLRAAEHRASLPIEHQPSPVVVHQPPRGHFLDGAVQRHRSGPVISSERLA
jgi:hypothetical protein